MTSSRLTGPRDSVRTARSSRSRCLGTGEIRARCGAARFLVARGFASATARRKSSSLSGAEPIEIFLGVERGHAPAAGAGDRLAIDMVLHIARSEDAFDARRRGHALGSAARDDVAVAHVEL